MDRRLYVLISLEHDRLLEFLNVGHNIKKLLGYDRQDVKGSSTSLFLPPFFKKIH